MTASTTDTGDRAPASPPEDLAKLLQRSAAGDQDAFATLYDSTARRVFGLALMLIRDRAQAEEVAQEVYLRIWTTSGSFDASRGPAISWVLMHARSAAVSRIRAEHSRSNREKRFDREDGPIRRAAINPTHDLVDAALSARRVREALGLLSPLQREALELAYLAGHTYSEVADILEIPLGTAKTRLRDGLLKLRQLLDQPIAC